MPMPQDINKEVHWMSFRDKAVFFNLAHDELSDLSDSDFEYITDATDASSEGEFSSDMNENLKSHDNQILILLALRHQGNVLNQDQIMLKS